MRTMVSHTMMINYPRNPYDGNDSIMKMMESWKRSNNRREDCEEEESLFEDIVCYILYLIVGVL